MKSLAALTTINIPSNKPYGHSYMLEKRKVLLVFESHLVLLDCPFYPPPPPPFPPPFPSTSPCYTENRKIPIKSYLDRNPLVRNRVQNNILLQQ